MDSIQLTKKLISLQSFKDGKNQEKPLTDFLIKYIRKTYPWLNITTQNIEKNRQNILIKDNSPTKLLIINHTDTVQPTKDWKTNPTKAKEENGKIYGLGASDSKANTAAFLEAIKQTKETEGLAFLLYVDEEYDFKGLKKFTKSNIAKTINPKTIISIDGNGKKLGNACRGIIEFTITITTKSGHSANPKNQGSLKPLLRTYEKLENSMKNYKTKEQGIPTIQIASINSGLKTENNNLKSVGNMTPNYTKAKIEIRTTQTLTWNKTLKIIKEELSKYKDIQFKINKNINLKGYETQKEKIKKIETAIKTITGKTEYLNPKTFGYLDLSMLKEIYPKANLCSIGIGEPNQNHKPDEYIKTESILTGVKIYKKIIETLLS